MELVPQEGAGNPEEALSRERKAQGEGGGGGGGRGADWGAGGQGGRNPHLENVLQPPR